MHKNFVFYNVFVAFVELNNNTIVAMQNIEFGSVSSDRYPDPAENASIEAIPIGAPLMTIWIKSTRTIGEKDGKSKFLFLTEQRLNFLQ